MSTPHVRNWQGPAILGYGFRLFFLAGALYAGFAIVCRLMLFFGSVVLPAAFTRVDWYVHGLVFG